MSGHGPHQADRLLALPIRGESFLLQREAHTILVDGGYKSDRVAPVLRSLPTPIERLDVVVCTHGDRDHAGGLVDLLGDRDIDIGELWLPGRWADVVPELIQNPKAFVDRLITELDETEDGSLREIVGVDDSDTFEAAMFGHIHDQRSRAFLPPDRAREPESSDIRGIRPDLVAEDGEPIDFDATDHGAEPAWFASLRHEFKRREDAGALRAAFRSGRQRVQYRRRRTWIGRPAIQFWLELMDTAEAIRGIADYAIRRQLGVRWFDFHEFSRTRQRRGGIRNFLIPLNAVEQAPPPQMALSYIARLTPINEECLAFLAPPSWHRLGVVFCGDSPMGDGEKYKNSFLADEVRLDTWLPVVATAPHHGSESNACAYQHVGAWANVCVWLRAGGSAKQPGPTFQALDFPHRVCSKCPQSGKRPALAVVASSLGWIYCCPLMVLGHVCDCR